MPMTVRNTIDSYRKKRHQTGPLIIGILAGILVVAGIVIIVISLTGGLPIGGVSSTKKPGWNPFASETPTPTMTFTPTSTSTLTETPTETLTPTITLTPTPSSPYTYVVQQNDTLYSIIESHGLKDRPEALILILMLNPYHPENTNDSGINPATQIIYPGQTIMLPNPDMPLPTATPWPVNAPRGTKIIYMVMPGDSLGLIATKCNSTVDEIVKANKDVLVDGAASIIYPGQLLIVPVNIVTPIPTFTPTATP